MAADYVPQTQAEEDDFVERAIDLLRAPTHSGYREVYVSPTAGRWQAKPYVGPGKQRNLGTFPTAREAAAAVFWFRQGKAAGTLLPIKSPDKERNRRGQGRKPRDRRKGMHLTLTHIPPNRLTPCRRVPQCLESIRGRQTRRAPRQHAKLSPQRCWQRRGRAPS